MYHKLPEEQDHPNAHAEGQDHPNARAEGQVIVVHTVGVSISLPLCSLGTEVLA